MLVLWPPWAHVDLLHGSEALTYACSQLQDSNNTRPTGHETDLVNIVLARAKPSDAASVVTSVCRVAIAWDDLDLWNRAVKVTNAERSIAALQEPNILSALKKFGFNKMKPRYCELVHLH